MTLSARYWCGLATLLLALATCPAADEPLSRVEIGKIGKAATALVELSGRRGYGSAFCVHPSGLFLTNEHVAQGDVSLILNPGLKTEKVCPAKVVRSDKGVDLALLRVEGVKDLPALAIGSDNDLSELMEVVAFGFPFGTALAPDRKEYPTVSVNAGSITSLRRKGDRLHRIQLDVALNPGNSGGPVLDRNGKVVGVVVAGVQGSGVNFAIPANEVATFVARPDIEFDPPTLNPANVYRPVLFEARVVPVLPSDVPLTVDLILKPAEGREKSHRMEAAAGKYRVSAAPLPPPPGPLALRLLAQFDNGLLNATTADRDFKVGGRALKLSEVRSLQLKPQPRALLHDGKSAEGPVSGLDAVPVRLGEQSLPVDLARAAEVKFAAAVETDEVWYTLLVRQGDKEIFRQTECLVVEGLLPTPTAAAGPRGIKPPLLEGNPAVRKLASAVSDVAVGGAGRYLVLHLPALHKLAVFDVSAAEVVGHIPVKEEKCLFAAGLKDVVVVLPGAGTMERWSLKTFEREVAVALPVKGVPRAVAMGSASRGPLLMHWAVGTQDLDRASFALFNVERMQLAESDLKVYPALGHSYRDLVHLRASANGKVFGMWCTSHSPSGVGVIIAGGAGAQSYYGHWSGGHVLPGPDGTLLFTGVGTCAPQQSLVNAQQPQGETVLPACHGDYYLSLPRPGHLRFPQPGRPAGGPDGAVTLRAPGKDRPIATLTDLKMPAPDEQWIKHDFTFDKRVHLIPEARLIVTIPVTDDRLVLCRYGGAAGPGGGEGGPQKGNAPAASDPPAPANNNRPQPSAPVNNVRAQPPAPNPPVPVNNNRPPAAAPNPPAPVNNSRAQPPFDDDSATPPAGENPVISFGEYGVVPVSARTVVILGGIAGGVLLLLAALGAVFYLTSSRAAREKAPRRRKRVDTIADR
jgi:hypothetical protein